MKSMETHYKTVQKQWKHNDETNKNQWKNHRIHEIPSHNPEKNDETYKQPWKTMTKPIKIHEKS